MLLLLSFQEGEAGVRRNQRGEHHPGEWRTEFWFVNDRNVDFHQCRHHIIASRGNNDKKNTVNHLYACLLDIKCVLYYHNTGFSPGSIY